MRRILVITYYYPPSTASGANRWAAMVRHMRALGHRLWVVTSTTTGAWPDDAEQGIVRAADLVTSPRLRAALRRPALAQPGASVLEPRTPVLLTRGLVPDSHVVTWVPAAVRAARRLIAEQAIECVITSGPPDSAHVAGLLLGRRRPAWIADFRDGWTFQPLGEPWPTSAQRWLDRRLERAVATHAERVIGATRPIAADLEQRLGARAAWVSNGWDPLVEPDVDAAGALLAPPDGRFVRLVHTGTLSGAWGRDPRPLLDALRAFNDRNGGRRVQLVLAGRLTGEERSLLDGAGLGEGLLHLGLLDRGAAVALQRSADGLLLLTSTNTSEATGKLFEYLAARRPIVALAQGSEAGRIVAATHSGVVVAPSDRDAITAALRALVDGEIAFDPAPERSDAYVYPGPARSTLELVEQAIAQRA